jgi:hypothetical protein
VPLFLPAAGCTPGSPQWTKDKQRREWRYVAPDTLAVVSSDVAMRGG